MYNQNNFHTNGNDHVIVTVDNVETDYGRLRSFETESGIKFVTDLRNYGDMVEIFREDSIAMGAFDGEANFKLTIEVDESPAPGTMYILVTDNADVDRLCRILTTESSKIVRVQAMGRILATYDSYEDIEKSKGLEYFYSDITEEDIEATTWPRAEMNYDIAVTALSEAIRDELVDKTFGDKELYWNDQYGHPVATGYSGSSGVELSMVGFDVSFTEAQVRSLITLGKLGTVERNDSMMDDDL